MNPKCTNENLGKQRRFFMQYFVKTKKVETFDIQDNTSYRG